MKKSTVSNVTKTAVDIFFFFGIVCVICVPFLERLLRTFYGYGTANSRLMIGVLFASGICAVYILYNFKRMFKTLSEGNPFVRGNIKCFGRMAVACAVIALIYLIKCVFMFSLATITIICVFAIAALFCLTMRDIFAQAAEYKEENDWTV